jgi:hypothetical protein
MNKPDLKPVPQTDADDEESVGAEHVKRRSRGIFLSPNLFTAGCLFCGFYAIVIAMNGTFAPSEPELSCPAPAVLTTAAP